MNQLYNTDEGKYPDKKKNTEHCFYGNGWKVERIENEYFLFYLVSAQGGEEAKVKITKEIFEGVQVKPMGLKEIFENYNLQKL